VCGAGVSACQNNAQVEWKKAVCGGADGKSVATLSFWASAGCRDSGTYCLP
jgi:hypothetical protein